ncbi:AAA family ATPase [uncultured Desulfobacter sp.]|uniref:AAA family ATPase n=1 Tax=uncultured Desulfobacter sp. TaxID=240139 RepID=UPI0029C99F2F|nr:AAA family ATPase [uncultured Desulfobacter sp.]
MYVKNLNLRNWRNFTHADIDFKETVYVIGPNAAGKSNLLDIFRFMRDVVNPKGGGLQHAIDSRGGLKKIRSLAARRHPWVELDFDFRDNLENEKPDWRYRLRFSYEGKGKQRPVVLEEEVWKHGRQLVNRPDEDDKTDSERSIQTYLEQINMNKEYREISTFFSDVLYLHLVPQLLKYNDQLSLRHLESDPFGQGLLEEIAKTRKRTRDFRLRTIEEILVKVIPNLEQLQFKQDEVTGRPHLEMLYNHWRPKAGWQREDQFSDGTLRLLAILWTLLSTNRMILLEEPELSLHKAIVEQIPGLLYKTRQRRSKSGGQIIISTHSEVMLSDNSIRGSFLMLHPGQDGEATTIRSPSEKDILAMQAGLSAADILLPQTSATIQRI